MLFVGSSSNDARSRAFEGLLCFVIQVFGADRALISLHRGSTTFGVERNSYSVGQCQPPSLPPFPAA